MNTKSSNDLIIEKTLLKPKLVLSFRLYNSELKSPTICAISVCVCVLTICTKVSYLFK